MIIVWEVITGENHNIFARQEDAILLHGIVKHMVTSNGKVPEGYPLSVNEKHIFGIESIVLMTSVASVLADWMMNISIDQIAVGFEDAVWPPDTPYAGYPVFTDAEKTNIQIARAQKKLLSSIDESERLLLFNTTLTTAQLFATGSN